MAVSNSSIINSNAEWLLDFHTSNVMQNAIPAKPWLRLLVPSLSLRRPGSVRVGFVMDKVAVGQVFLQVLHFSPVNIIPLRLHTHILSEG
jgi:hypothetical protein